MPRRIEVQIHADTSKLERALATAHRRARVTTARSQLIRLKYALVDAYTAGATPNDLATTLGRPWTPELLAQAFPDVERTRREAILEQTNDAYGRDQ